MLNDFDVTSKMVWKVLKIQRYLWFMYPDVMMPYKDGYTLKKLENNEVPIIF
jgi:hypothetical protein